MFYYKVKKKTIKIHSWYTVSVIFWISIFFFTFLIFWKQRKNSVWNTISFLKKSKIFYFWNLLKISNDLTGFFATISIFFSELHMTPCHFFGNFLNFEFCYFLLSLKPVFFSYFKIIFGIFFCMHERKIYVFLPCFGPFSLFIVSWYFNLTFFTKKL